MRILLLALPLLLAAQSASAQPASQRNIGLDVHFLTQPRETGPERGSFALHSAGAPDAGTAEEEETYRVLVSGDPSAVAARVLDAGGRVLSARGPSVHAEVTREQLGTLATDPAVEGLDISRPVQPLLSESRHAVGVPPLEAGDGLEQTFTGKGVLVGIIDTGIDIRHPAFRHENGDTRILSVWDQTIEFTDGSRRPDGFFYGMECTADQINGQLSGIDRACLTDDSVPIQGVPTFGHGTHVAGIAAGNDATYRGMAPEATIVAVRALFEELSILDAVDYVLDKADETGRPVVINLSLGTTDGAHDGTSEIEKRVSERVAPGQIIVAAAGNEARPDDGDEFGHASVDIPTDPDAYHHGPIVRPASRQQADADSFSIQLTMWSGNDTAHDIYVAALRQPSADFIVQNPEPDFLRPGDNDDVDPSATTTRAIWQDETTLAGYVHMASQVDPANQRRETRIYIDRCPDAPCVFGNSADPEVHDFSRVQWALNFKGQPEGGFLDIWPVNVTAVFRRPGTFGFTPTNDFWQSSMPFYGGDNTSTVTIPATARDIIAVGSQVQRAQFIDIEGRTQPPEDFVDAETGALSVFSSQGPARERDGAERIKPDLVGPGEWIFSARSLREELLPRLFDVAENYSAQRGTSMASPHVAGIIALMLQRNPTLRAADLIGENGLLTGNAASNGETGVLPNDQWGFGIVDAQAAFFDADFEIVEEADRTAPTISGAKATEMGREVLVTWTTDEPATSEVLLRDNGRDITAQSHSYVRNHMVRIRADSGTYTVLARSTDLAGNTSEETRVDSISLGGCGCGSTGSPRGADAAFLLAAFGAVALRLRRRSAARDA